MDVTTRPAILAILGDAVAVGGYLEACEVRLLTGDFVPSKDLVWADLTEAVFAGYTAGGVAVTWGTPFQAPDGTIAVEGGCVTWVATGAGLPVAITGFAVVLAADDTLVNATLFDAPVSLAVAGSGVEVKPRVEWGS